MKAEANFTKAIEIAPTNVEAYFMRKMLRRNRDDTRKH